MNYDKVLCLGVHEGVESMVGRCLVHSTLFLFIFIFIFLLVACQLGITGEDMGNRYFW